MKRLPRKYKKYLIKLYKIKELSEEVILQMIKGIDKQVKTF